MSILDVEHVFFYYGKRRALCDVTFHTDENEIIGLLGLNGAGKTTCLRMLAGLAAPNSGTIRLQGQDVYRKIPTASIGFMPEGLDPELRVEELLDFRARLCGFVSHQQRRQEIERLVDLCQVSTFSRRFAGELSTGMRQRVALAWALCGSPKLVLLDEPSFGLDPHQQRILRDIIKSAASNACVMVSSHGLDELARIANRFLVLHEGQLLHDGTCPSESLLDFFLDITTRATTPKGEP